jgi:Protein of unknown function (DUF3558)
MIISPRIRRSLITPLLVASTAGLAVAGCGDEGKTEAKAPLGSKERPLVAQPSETVGTSGKKAAPAREPGSVATRAQESIARTATGGKPSAASSESGSVPKPNYAQLLANQSRHPNRRFSPCNLVTGSEAAAIVGASMQKPVEAPQGPTCVYRTRTGRQLIALAVQSVRFAQIKAKLAHPRTTTIAGRTAFCGTYGQPMLYVPLSAGRVLSVSAPCGTAKGFAAKALPNL